MKRSRPIKRGGPIARGKRPKARNPARQRREFARAYGSPERVAWVKGLSCTVCGITPCDNAHTANGGAGRKADYRTIVPLCSGRFDAEGCHAELHRIGVRTFEETYRINLASAAVNVALTWDHLVAQAGGD